MKKVVFTKHLRVRMKVRNFPENYPVLIYHNPDRVFYDNAEGSEIAVKKLKYAGKLTNIMVAYLEFKDFIKIFTIHAISEQQINNRIENKRWTEK